MFILFKLTAHCNKQFTGSRGQNHTRFLNRAILNILRTKLDLNYWYKCNINTMQCVAAVGPTSISSFRIKVRMSQGYDCQI